MFHDDSFDVALAVITLHHWTDPVSGLRVAGQAEQLSRSRFRRVRSRSGSLRVQARSRVCGHAGDLPRSGVCVNSGQVSPHRDLTGRD